MTIKYCPHNVVIVIVLSRMEEPPTFLRKPFTKSITSVTLVHYPVILLIVKLRVL